jgi:rhodanese-related sulfurtransferase
MNFKNIVAIIVGLTIAGGVTWWFYNEHFNVDIISAEVNKESTRPQAPMIDTEELHRKLVAGEEFLLIDVRDNDEFLEQHVDGAINLPLQQIDQRYAEIFPFTREIVTMCSGNNDCKLSRKGSTRLIELGFTNVKNYRDGVVGWKLAGYPLVLEGGKKIGSLDRLIEGQITAADLQQKREQQERIAIIDMRQQEEFAAGHIPGAISIARGDVSRHADTINASELIVIVDQNGDMAGQAAIDFRDSGYTNVKALVGGMAIWNLLGYDVE